MTLKQIEQTRAFLICVDSLKGLSDTQKLVDEMRAYYGKEFIVELKIRINNTLDSYSSNYCDRDKRALKGFLEGYLAKQKNIDIICSILNQIEESKSLKDETARYNYLIKIYHSYHGKIYFDKIIDFIASAPKEAIKIQGYQITEEMIFGLITKLRLYANELCVEELKPDFIGTKQEINFQPHINVEATNETTLNMSILFDDARQQTEDLGLPDKQYNVVMEKIAELETSIKNKESKGKRWQKVKDCMKWLVEQGIQVAGVLLPVLIQVIQ